MYTHTYIHTCCSNYSNNLDFIIKTISTSITEITKHLMHAKHIFS